MTSKWFAWHPVRVGVKLVWLQWVTRTGVFTGFALDCADNGGYKWEYSE